jgi:hypothetical protein
MSRPADACAVIVDNNDFLVVRPEPRHYLPNQYGSKVEEDPHTFGPDMVRVAHASNVRMEGFKSFL